MKMVGLFLFTEESGYLRYSQFGCMLNSIVPTRLSANMSYCSCCRRDLPGLETLCQQCFEAGCDRLAHSKPWWQRFQLWPQFTWDNFIGFSLLFAIVFVSLRFDFPYFHPRHMRTTETSALMSTLFACTAFFHRPKGKSQVVAARLNTFEYKTNWRRFSLLVAAEAIAGLFLYTLFTFIPVGLQMLITVAGWVIVEIEIWTFPKNRSLGSVLSAITGVAGFLCLLAWRITHREVWSRLGLVGGCLIAGLILLDRRQEWLDS